MEHCLMVPDEHKNTVPFILNRAQRVLDDAIEYIRLSGLPVRLFIPKPRQLGISTYLIGRGYIRTQTRMNADVAIVSAEAKATQKLLSKAKFFMKYDKGGHPNTSYNSKQEIGFPDSDGVMSIFTAGASEHAGRGGTPDYALFSECAFYNKPEEFIAGLLQGVAIRGTEVYYESTGNQAQSWYHNKCNSALRSRGIERMIFLPWTLADKYQIELEPGQAEEILADLDDSLEEPHVVEHYGLTAEQLLWRRFKIEEFNFNLDLFKQEYPLNLQECFMSGSDNFFYKTNFVKTERWKQYDKHTHLLAGHPNPKLHYSLGADVAAGVEKDRSTIEIICVESQDVVAEFKSDILPPDMFALEIETLGQMFGWPIAVVESNNHGGVTLDNLLKNKTYPVNRIFFEDQYTTPRAGFNTNRKTKYILLGKLRQAVATELTFYSQELGAELSAFTEELKAVEGYHDDLVIALALANYGVEEALKHLAWEKSNQASYQVSQLGAIPGLPFDSLFGQKTVSGLKQQIKG